jgi:hypothetical protein
MARDMGMNGHEQLVKDGNGVLVSETLLLCVR